MNYEIFQIVLSRSQINEINSGATPEYYDLYRDTRFEPSAEQIVAAKHLYNKVAVIAANNLNEVFHIGNVGPEESIQRLAPMHSLSVGDVIVDENGVAKFVDSFGFGDVNF